MKEGAIIPILPPRIVDEEGAVFVLSKAVCEPQTHKSRCEACGGSFQDIGQRFWADLVLVGAESGMDWVGK
jgi:hypothetical protein